MLKTKLRLESYGSLKKYRTFRLDDVTSTTWHPHVLDVIPMDVGHRPLTYKTLKTFPSGNPSTYTWSFHREPPPQAYRVHTITQHCSWSPSIESNPQEYFLTRILPTALSQMIRCPKLTKINVSPPIQACKCSTTNDLSLYRSDISEEDTYPLSTCLLPHDRPQHEYSCWHVP
jgi:hypothetical protein